MVNHWQLLVNFPVPLVNWTIGKTLAINGEKSTNVMIGNDVLVLLVIIGKLVM